MRREGADREIKSLQAKGGQADHHAEDGTDDRRGGERHRYRRINVCDHTATVKAPAATKPACPSEIWPVVPISNLSASAPTTAMKT